MAATGKAKLLAGSSGIEWTGETWNPFVGCTIHSAGCKGCYAMGEAWRKMHHPNPKIAKKFAGTAKKVNGHAVWTGKINFSPEALLMPLRRRVPTTYFVNSLSDLFHQSISDEKIDLVFAVMALCPQHTFQVLTKRADRMRAYFAETWQPAPAQTIRLTTGDIDVPAETRGDDRWDQINAAIDDITLGTYGSGELFEHNRFWTGEGDLIGRPAWPRRPLPNVWLGVSVEDQRAADERIPELLATPAAVRFLSCEPLIGPVDLGRVQAPRYVPEDRELDWKFDTLEVGDYYEFEDSLGVWEGGDGPYREHRIDWVIAGGESGKSARPMHPDWVRDLRDQCANASLHGDPAAVPFFFKQWGEWAPGENAHGPQTRTERVASLINDDWHYETLTLRVSEELHADDGPDVWRFGKKGAGRLLDGVRHDGMPAR